MTRFNSLVAAVVVAAGAALVAGAPVAQAQTSCGTGCLVHFVGAGSSAQFQMAAIAADQAALATGRTTVKHWSKKFKASTGDGAYLSDNRNGNIVNQTGNVWVVWIESGTTVSDIWIDVSVDSTVGVRCALAYETNGLGCQAQITSAATTATDQIIPQGLWPDNAADTPIDIGAIDAINTSISGGQHVNVGLTDIRAEDAEYATKRLICATRNATLTCLGDELVANVGNNIVTGQGTGSFAQPVGFSLPGEKDPFNTHLTVPTTFTTLPVGAAPIVFIENNGGSTFPTNLVTGVTPDLHATGQKYPLANLFDGSSDCDTGNLAFGGSGGGTNLTVFLREPLSGTMNTTEFSLFRSDGNSADSQEANSMGLTTGTGTCASGGSRSRAIGTGEVVGSSSPAYGVLGTPDSIGYIFTGWGNLAKFKAGANFQYLTLDGVDPIFAAPTAYSTCVGGTTAGQVCGTAEPCGGSGVCTPVTSTTQIVPYCGATVCTSDLWPAYTDPYTGYTVPAKVSYPNLRNGMYKAWSIYRWVTEAGNSDPYGPVLVAQEAQNYVDSDVADFVPFSACAPGTGNSCLPGSPTDGLAVYRSHFTPTGVVEVCPTATHPDNGSATGANALDGGNTLGGGPECGGDAGGLIVGPFGTNSPSVSYVTWTTVHTLNKGYKLTFKNGDAISGIATGTDVTLVCDGNNGVQTVTNTVVNNVAGVVYVSVANPAPGDTIACKLVDPNITHGTATTPGVVSKKQ